MKHKKGRRATPGSKAATAKTPLARRFHVQDSARVDTADRPVLEQALADQLRQIAAAASPATVESFACVECQRSLPADKLAFETDAKRGEGVCLTCDAEFAEAQEQPAPFGLVAAGADDGRYSLMGREVL
jgi:hypothetical protein